MDHLFWSVDNSSMSPAKICYGGWYLVRPPLPVGPVGQIWAFLFK